MSAPHAPRHAVAPPDPAYRSQTALLFRIVILALAQAGLVSLFALVARDPAVVSMAILCDVFLAGWLIVSAVKAE